MGGGGGRLSLLKKYLIFNLFIYLFSIQYYFDDSRCSPLPDQLCVSFVGKYVHHAEELQQQQKRDSIRGKFFLENGGPVATTPLYINSPKVISTYPLYCVFRSSFV